MNGIDSVRIRGFRSLADIQLSGLPDATVLIGANGAGKSNFIRFFEMMSWMLRVRRLGEFVARHGGAGDQLYGGSARTPRMEAEVSLRTDRGRNDYRFSLSHAHPDRFIFTEEAFRYSSDETYGKVSLRWKAKRMEETFGAHLTSDGSLRFFALVTLLNLPPEMLPDVLLLDEPELGLHPAAVALIGDMVKSLAAESRSSWRRSRRCSSTRSISTRPSYWIWRMDRRDFADSIPVSIGGGSTRVSRPASSGRRISSADAHDSSCHIGGRTNRGGVRQRRAGGAPASEGCRAAARPHRQNSTTTGTMSGTNKKLTTAVETYLDDLRRIRASGGATGERSSYGPLANLLNAVGATLRPKVFCVGELADQGAGHPDFGLYTAKQVQRGRPREGQAPERGVVEVKSPHEDLRAPVVREQVTRYWGRYRLVLVTNLREFGLVGPDSDGGEAMLESFRLAESEEAFARRLEHPRAFARAVGAGLGEYLSRTLSHRAALAEPKDLAWLLASYARDGLARVEAAGDAPSLKAVRSALEDALGVRFEGERGARFFRSTLVQTLFYGVFSAWVLWARAGAGSSAVGGRPHPAGGVGYDTARFSWREAVWHLRAPVLRALFQQLSDPGRLQPLGLVEVLDWTAAALDRVDREAFFSRFNEGEAVPYFYEPFLEAFDPDLRKQLGVWYTPAEVVRYMVARVDRALKDDLDIPDGLAAENVYVLDPCCGTGAYLAEVLRRIAANLGGRGLGALAGARVRQAATERVFGFEIMPAPFVVAHLQVGLTMQDLDAPLADDGAERAGIFLTNALTGWEPRTTKPLPFPELEEERDRAERVKQETPILVILGNPPYNGFAGMAVDEERELSEAYRTTRRVRRPEGQGLNDLYVRFFRMAERRIAEKTGRGVVCFISNYSWLDGLSFTGMRERYLEAFDAIRIDCLNGDKYKTRKTRRMARRTRASSRPRVIRSASRSEPHRDTGAQGQARFAAGEYRLPSPLGSRRRAMLDCWRRRRRSRVCSTDCIEPIFATWPALRSDGGERGLVRLAGAARSVSGVVSGCQDQAAILSRRYRY